MNRQPYSTAAAMHEASHCVVAMAWHAIPTEVALNIGGGGHCNVATKHPLATASMAMAGAVGEQLLQARDAAELSETDQDIAQWSLDQMEGCSDRVVLDEARGITDVLVWEHRAAIAALAAELMEVGVMRTDDLIRFVNLTPEMEAFRPLARKTAGSRAGRINSTPHSARVNRARPATSWGAPASMTARANRAALISKHPEAKSVIDSMVARGMLPG